MSTIKQSSRTPLAPAALLVSVFIILSASAIAKAVSWTAHLSTTVQTLQASEFDTLVQAANQAYQSRKFDEALANCKKAIALNPKDFRPHAIAGLTYAAQLKMTTASAEFATVIRLNPQAKEYYILKANADIRLGDLEEAIALCDEALKLDPNFAVAYATMGEVMFRSDRLNDTRYRLRS